MPSGMIFTQCAVLLQAVYCSILLRKYTLAVGLAAFRGQYRTQWDLMMAAAPVITLPIVVIFFFAQKRFIQGITLTGMKG